MSEIPDLLIEGLNGLTLVKNIVEEWDEKLDNWVMKGNGDVVHGDEEVLRGENTESRLSYYYQGSRVFGPDIVMPGIGDVVHISESTFGSENILEMTSVKKDGVSFYLELLKILPCAREDYSVILHPVKTHSSRYCSEPLVPAVQSWLEGRPSMIHLPSYLREYLKAANTYLKKEEWRTSTTLSAIAVESILAELYEEEFHQWAPDDPLGSLYGQIKDKIKDNNPHLLDDIDLYVQRASNARIAAVHRGSTQVSPRESLDALRSAMRATIWKYFVDNERRYTPS
jgi:hypothetical protein